MPKWKTKAIFAYSNAIYVAWTESKNKNNQILIRQESTVGPDS